MDFCKETYSRWCDVHRWISLLVIWRSSHYSRIGYWCIRILLLWLHHRRTWYAMGRRVGLLLLLLISRIMVGRIRLTGRTSHLWLGHVHAVRRHHALLRSGGSVHHWRTRLWYLLMHLLWWLLQRQLRELRRNRFTCRWKRRRARFIWNRNLIIRSHSRRRFAWRRSRCTRCFQGFSLGSLDLSQHLVSHLHGKTTKVWDQVRAFSVTSNITFWRQYALMSTQRSLIGSSVTYRNISWNLLSPKAACSHSGSTSWHQCSW